jgi:long-chain fatty acid transport protein
MMSRNLRRIAMTGAATTIALVNASAAYADAFYLHAQSVRAAGRAYSGEVADQGAASLWWNPAAIAGNKTNTLYGGVTAILPNSKATNTGTLIVRPGQAPAPVGGNQVEKNPLIKGALPTAAVGYRLNDQWAIGFAMTSPFSFTTNYSGASWARYNADKTKLTTLDFQPVVAFQPTPEIGFGVAMNIEYSKASLSTSLPNLSPLQADGHQTLRGKGWDFGFSVGTQIHPMEGLDIGLSYKSAIKHTLKGSLTLAGLQGPLAGQNGRIGGLKTKFSTPWQANAGVRYRVTEPLVLNAQLVRFGWKKFDALRIGPPVSGVVTENYKSVWAVSAGFDYDASEKWTLRSGIQFSQTPTQDSQRSPRVPDGSRTTFAAGGSYKWSDRLTIDAAATYLAFKKNTLDRPDGFYPGSPAQTIVLTNGRVSTHVLTFGLGARMDF